MNYEEFYRQNIWLMRKDAVHSITVMESYKCIDGSVVPIDKARAANRKQDSNCVVVSFSNGSPMRGVRVDDIANGVMNCNFYVTNPEALKYTPTLKGMESKEAAEAECDRLRNIVNKQADTIKRLEARIAELENRGKKPVAPNVEAMYASKGFDDRQIRVIKEGMSKGLDVNVFAKPGYSFIRMSFICEAMSKHYDFRYLLDTRFNDGQLAEIMEGLRSGLDVSVFAKPMLPRALMENKRRDMCKKLGKPFELA